ncbi:MAG: SurA N-terminal domain-containing protein [Bacteroidales bacterium]|nr:SurA N-terminal domain-containing protein [Bacteroidales bacterium]
MAAIGNIRKHSGLLIVVVGIAMAAFILGDFMKGSPRKSNIIGVVNGEKITYPEFSQKVEEGLEVEKQNKNTSNLTEVESYGVRQRIWNSFVKEILLGQEYEEIGLTVSIDELSELIYGKNPHQFIRQNFVSQETGVFDPGMVRRFMQNLDQMDQVQLNQWKSFKEAIINDRKEKKFDNLFSDAYFIPQPFAENLYKESNTNASIRIFVKNYSRISDSSIVYTDEDIQNYYKENKEKFKQTESRDIDYVTFEIKASKKDHAKIKESVDEIYNDFLEAQNIKSFVNATSDTKYDSIYYKDEHFPVNIAEKIKNQKPGIFVPPYIDNNAYHMAKLINVQYRPDSMKATHILIAYNQAYRAAQKTERTKDEASALADSLFKVVKRNPDKIESLALEFSNDGSVKENGGDLGWFADQAMIGQFNEAVIKGKNGEITMAETIFGFHIIKITGKQKPVKKYRVAVINRAIEPSSKTYQEVYVEASKFAGENTTAEAFQNAIVEQGLNKRSATNLAPMANNIPGIKNPRGIIRWAYEEGIEEESISKIFDMDGSYIIAIITKVNEKGIKDLKDVEKTITRSVIKNKKAELIEDMIATSIGKNINEIAADLEADVDTVENINFGSANLIGFGREPEVIGEIFSMEINKLSEPIQGNRGVYMVIIDEITEAPQGGSYAIVINPIIQSFQSRIRNNYLYRSLERISDIEDDRILYY